MDAGEEVFEDYVATRLTLRQHPASLLRPQTGGFLSADKLRDTPDGRWVYVCGLVISRQRPGTASGVIFLTLEDDTGSSNIVVWPKMFKRYRKEVMAGRLLRIRGKLQREGMVMHVIATGIEDMSWLLDQLGDSQSIQGRIDPSYDNADEARRPVPVLPDKSKQKEGRPVAEAITHELQKARQSSYGSGARQPREQAKKLLCSRDFH
jgi:error-prone DNA polymerase